MKMREDKMEDYIHNTLQSNLHPELELIPQDKNNRILYGPPGVGKYSQMLRMVYPYSPSHLKYEKKIQVSLNSQSYLVKFSDIHYEIDMELLGGNDKPTWHEMFIQIQDIIRNKYPHPWGIIVCKNFHKISSELLTIFYSYMQPLDDIKIVYYLLTEHISFIPSSLLRKFQVISVGKPSPEQFQKCFGRPMPPVLLNLKDSIKGNTHDCTTILCQNIIDHIGVSYMDMREEIYQLFILDVPVETCIEYLLFKLIPIIPHEKWNEVFKIVIMFYDKYHHNYRPLYHLEYFIYNLIRIHGYSNCKNDFTSEIAEQEGDKKTILQTSLTDTSR